MSRSLISFDDPTTWLLVSTSPSGEMTMPEPSPAALARVRRLGAGFDADHGGPDAFGDADHGIGIASSKA